MSSAPATLLGVVVGAISAAALLAGAVTLAATRRPASALAVLVDLLLAAGLLRLTGEPAWGTLATAAALVAIRRLLGWGLHRQRRDTSAPHIAKPSAAAATWKDSVLSRLLRPAWRE